MSLLVKNLSGRTLCLQFDDFDHVQAGEVKNALQDLEGVPAGLQRLTLASKELADDSLLSDYGSSWDDLPPIQMVLSLLGGKGGFGAMLRSAGKKAGQKKMTNFSACRDLNGRRLRHVDAEKQIAEWNETEHKTDHQKLKMSFAKITKGKAYKNREQFDVDVDEKGEYLIIRFKYDKYILDTFKAAVPEEARSFQKFSSQWHVEKKSADLMQQVIQELDWTFSPEARLWIYGASGPESVSRSKKKFRLKNLGRGLTAPERDENLEEDMEDSVASGMARLKKRQADAQAKAAVSKKRKLAQASSDEEEEEDDDDDEEEDGDILLDSLMSFQTKRTKRRAVAESDDDANDEPEPTPNETATTNPPLPVPTTAPTEDETPKAAEKQAEPETKKQEVEVEVKEPEKPKVYKAFTKFDDYASAEDLEEIGLDHLKQELTKNGLKGGGSLTQRAERLFLLKNTPIDKIPKKHRAKAKK